MDITTIFLFFTFACLGASIGALIQRAQDRRTPPPMPPPTPPSTHKLAGEGDVQVFSAWRTRNNKVWLEMDGLRLEDKEALQAKQRQRLIDMVVSLRTWLETARPSSPTTAPISVTPQQTIQPSTIVTPHKTIARVDKGAKPIPAFKSIVEQIDDVLQVKLIASPFNDREISLVEGSDGTVIVKDGKNRYAGIDAVPDPEIKALIRQAVAEWEKIS
jgi:hypothetical protein